MNQFTVECCSASFTHSFFFHFTTSSVTTNTNLSFIHPSYHPSVYPYSCSPGDKLRICCCTTATKLHRIHYMQRLPPTATLTSSTLPVACTQDEVNEEVLDVAAAATTKAKLKQANRQAVNIQNRCISCVKIDKKTK